MLIQLIQDRAEERFLEALEGINQKSVNRGVLFCAFSRVPLKVDPDAVLSFLKDILRDQDGELYFFADGDVAVCWRGRVKGVLEPIIQGFVEHYREKLGLFDRENLFRFYDGHVHGEDLRLLIRAKLKQ